MSTGDNWVYLVQSAFSKGQSFHFFTWLIFHLALCDGPQSTPYDISRRMMIFICGWRYLMMIFRRRTFENHHLKNFGPSLPCQDPGGAQLASFNHY